MENSQVLLDQVLRFLRSHGYPDDAFALEWAVSKSHRADLAVVDTVSGKPIALVELKATDAEASLRMGREQLRTLQRELGADVLLFLAYPRRGGISPVIERVMPVEPSPIEAHSEIVPSFTIAQSTQRTKEQAALVSERKQSVDRFAVTCWIAAFGVMALGVLDYLDILPLTAERLTVLGITIGLVILPFASKLKFLGWEFQRLQQQKSNSDRQS